MDFQEVIECIHGVQNLVAGPAFTDTATMLFILCRKLQLETTDMNTLQPLDILSRLDEFLGILGLKEVSLVQLCMEPPFKQKKMGFQVWNNCVGDFQDQRQEIFSAARSVLETVLVECIPSC